MVGTNKHTAIASICKGKDIWGEADDMHVEIGVMDIIYNMKKKKLLG